MRVLLLEDDLGKRQEIAGAVREFVEDVEIVEVGNWLDYVIQLNENCFHLILLDLLVPRSPKDPKVEDHCTQLVEATRGPESKAYGTPAIVFTRYLEQSEDFLQELNRVDINVISFSQDGKWKEALGLKLTAAMPPPQYPFVICCALSKEVMAYESLVDSFGKLRTISGLLCREVTISGHKGIIVQFPRMGLVTAGVVAALAIERFNPRLICMSGICGGVPDASEIYDVLISDLCHQHDVGKWGDSGFKSEHYDIQISASVRNFLEGLMSDPEVKKFVGSDLNVKKSEYPEGMEEIDVRFKLVATSSGSAVMAEQGHTSSLVVGQRKLAGFDMEVFAVYEAARLSSQVPLFFATKSVVDDGDKNKGDRFHRVGCLLSAKFVVCTISSGLLDIHS